MIHIKENVMDDRMVTVEVAGVLDQGAITVLRNVCDRHLDRQKIVLLDLAGLIHITREGIGFLHGIRQKVSIKNLPEFVRLNAL